MTGLWLAAAALTTAVLAFVLSPLWRRRPPAVDRSTGSDVALYRDQLAEVDRDLARGLIEADAADSARTEIKRRLLAAAREEVPPIDGDRRHRPLITGVLALMMAAAAFTAYSGLGRPDIADRPRLAGGAPTPSGVAPPAAPPPGFEEAVARLKQRLAEDPDDVDGWLLLGRSMMALSRPAEAADALARALAISDRPDIHADRGEALVDAAAGRVTDAAREAFAAAVAAAPAHPKALYYLALDRAQQGDVAAALQGWVDLWALSPAEAPWRPVLTRQIVRAAGDLATDPASLRPSPSALARGAIDAALPPFETLVAMLPPAERDDVLRRSAATLEARLAGAPADPERWSFLARVLAQAGQSAAADAARTRAADLQKR